MTFHHLGHTHPFLGPLQGACEGSFVINSHGQEQTFYEIQLTVEDDGTPLGEAGTLIGTTSIEIFPREHAHLAPGVDAMKRFADSLSAIDCNVLQSNRFRGLTATFLAHKPSVTPSYWAQKHPFRPEKEGFMQLIDGS